MKLFLVSKISELLLNEIVNTPPHLRLVVCESHAVEPLAKLGVSSFVIELPPTTVPERDADFSRVAMPGIFEDIVFDGTLLPVWKVLGIDRLRFWYYPIAEYCTQLVKLFSFEELVLSFDLTSTWIWSFAQATGANITAIKVSQILTREHLDFLNWQKIHTLVVSYDQEKQFLLGQKTGVKKIISHGMTPPSRPRDAELREKTIGLYYQSAFDWKAMTMMMSLDLGGKTLVVGFPNNKEWSRFLTTFPKLAQNPQVELQDAIGLFQCEEILLPHYDESIIRQIPTNARITYYDIANTEKARMFSEAGI